MQLVRVNTILLLGLLLAVVLVPASAHATEVDMWKLPAYDQHGCLNCHNNSRFELEANLALGEQLNPFGSDWLDLGREWDEKIAGKDSDGDRCLNGAEMGDYTGRWRSSSTPEPHDDAEISNPGSVDCTPASLGDRSWGILKAVFGDANKHKVR